MSRYVDTLDSLPLYAGRAEADRRGRVIDVTYAPASAVHDFTAGEHISVSGDVISVTGISELVPGDNITITASGVSAIISASGGGVTYNAGSGIDITNDTISLEDPINLVAGSNITIEVTGVSAVISSTGGGSSYTAGTGIDITNNVISVDNTVAMKTDIVEYTAGNNIDITNDTISVTGTGDLIAGANITITASGTDFVISSTGGGGGAATLPISGVDGYYTAEYDVDHATLEYNLPSVGGGEPSHSINEIRPDTITLTNSYDGDVTNSSVFICSDYIQFKGNDNTYTTVDPYSINNWNDAIVASQIASAAVVQSLPANPVSNVLYLIPEA